MLTNFGFVRRELTLAHLQEDCHQRVNGGQRSAHLVQVILSEGIARLPSLSTRSGENARRFVPHYFIFFLSNPLFNFVSRLTTVD